MSQQKKIKVLRIINRLNIGGPPYNATYLTKYLSSNYTTTLVAGEKEDHEDYFTELIDKLDVKPLMITEMRRSLKNPIQDYKAYRRLRKIIKEYKPDIVHTHAAKPGMLGRLAAHHEKVPVIIHTYHGHYFHSYFGKLKTAVLLNIERYLASISTRIVTISKQQKKEIGEVYKVAPQSKLVTIPLGFDLSKFSNNREENRKNFREEFQLKDNEIAVGIIGRLVAVKNHDLFLRGVRNILQEAKKDNLRFFIVGDGDLRPQLESMAKEFNIGYNIETDKQFNQPLVFTSWRTDMDVVFNGLDIVCLTSLNEGTPVSLIEAQASGKAIVSTRVGGIEDVVLENETALLCDSDDEEGFTTQLRTLLIEHPEKIAQLGEKSVEHVSKKFHYMRLVNDMENLYDGLINNVT